MSQMPPAVVVRENPVSIKRVSSWTYVVFFFGVHIRCFEGMNAIGQFRIELKKWGQSTGLNYDDVKQAFEGLTGMPFVVEEKRPAKVKVEAGPDAKMGKKEAASVAA